MVAYDEFPDPMQDGDKITVQGVPYVQVDGNWKPVNPPAQTKKGRERGSLNFGE